MAAANDVKFSLKVTINKAKTKVLFVEANGDFVDVLLSFLTIPLGKFVKILNNHFGDKAPFLGSLNTLYNGLDNLEGVHFWTEGARQLLLNPRSSFDAERCIIKLDIADTQPPEYLTCGYCSNQFPITSIYYDTAVCKNHGVRMKRKRCEKKSRAGDGDGDGGGFTKNSAAFIISDDLHIIPCATELTRIFSILGITNTDGAELIYVSFGFSETMDLLKASLVSSTPLSDVILSQKRQRVVKSEAGTPSLCQIEKGTVVYYSKKMLLKVIIQTSTNKLLYVRAEEDFVDLLCSFLTIPVGSLVLHFGSKSTLNSINNIYKSVADLIDAKFFQTPDMKYRLKNMKLPHGSISENQILPLTEESLSGHGQIVKSISSFKFPNGQGSYVKGPRSYILTDDLTVTPFSMSWTISMLNSVSDIKEVELQIGVLEALNILQTIENHHQLNEDSRSIKKSGFNLLEASREIETMQVGKKNYLELSRGIMK